MQPLGPILLIEDDPAVVQAIRLAVRSAGGEIKAIAHPDELAGTMQPGRHVAALLDMNFRPGAYDGRGGIDAIARIRSADPTLAIVTLTVHGGVALAIEALKAGASDFLLKPWRNDRLVEALRAAAALTARLRAGEAMSLDEIERQAIARALDRHEGNVSRTASALGITRPALYRRMEKHGL
ncbi:MAG TPA: response regulator [Sphingobium sp.]|nr:response regulator [Sphingobium sp.]